MRNEGTAKSYQSAGADQAGELSLLQVFWNDGFAFISAIIAPILWAVFLFLMYQDGTGMSTPFIIIGVVVTIAGIGVFLWRVNTYRTLFADNQAAQANITDVSFWRDRGRASFTFTYNGQKYATGSPLMKTGRTKALRVGETVTVLVDRNNPKSAIIRKLFTTSG